MMKKLELNLLNWPEKTKFAISLDFRLNQDFQAYYTGRVAQSDRASAF